MRAIVQAADLARAMRDVERASARKGHIAVLRNVLLEARPGRLRLVATDLTELVIREIPARGVVAGETSVPARLLRDLARELKTAGPLLLEREIQQSFSWGAPAESLLVMARPFNFTAHLAAIAANEYPAVVRDFDLGEWGWFAPGLQAVAA